MSVPRFLLRPTLRNAFRPSSIPRPASRLFSTAKSAPQTPLKAYLATGIFAATAGGLALSFIPTHHADAPHLDRTQIPAPALGYPPGPIPGVEQIESGSSSVPTFPNKLFVTKRTSADLAGEYACLGVGVRMVSFFKAHVYVLGFYVHVDDLGEVQKALVQAIHGKGGASMCTPGEREELVAKLLDPEEGNKIMNAVLTAKKDGRGVRAIVRVVPSRNTRFAHLRDGWVRSVSSKIQQVLPPVEGPEAEARVAEGLKALKDVFREDKRTLYTGQTMLLARGSQGDLGVYIDVTGRNDGYVGNGAGIPPKEIEGIVFDDEKLGQVNAEEICRALFLGYLAGKNVASNIARGEIVKLMADLTSKPLGTPTLMSMYE